jgi:TolB-like protein/DNA-binding winged helix-turn-helix (wHTH) protein/Tfp pilus assembly protein PilF
LARVLPDSAKPVEVTCDKLSSSIPALNSESAIATSPSQPHVVRFGVFEVDLDAGEVRKAGLRQKLVGQPFQVLQALLEHPGEIVTREEIRQRLWPDNIFVDYELALKKAVNRLREVLGDSADSPRFIETIPRRGYRFIGSLAPPPIPSEPVRPASETSELQISSGRNQARFLPRLIASAALLAIAGILLWLNADKLRTRIFATSRSTEIHSIAVLPFKNLSKDPEQEYFVDGMTDELITDLAKIGQLRVISHTSVMPYKGVGKPLGTIAGELSVDAIVEGTVLRSGNRVRVTAQLLGASPERHLWADSYQGDLADVLSLQDRVARSIAREIRVTLTPEEQARLTSLQPMDPEAYDAYVLGRHFAAQLTPDGFEKAVVNFGRAIELQPHYARAYADLAETYCWAVATQAMPAQEGLLKARQAGMKALELDEANAQAHSSLAWVKYAYEWNFPEAEREFHRSLDLNPGASWGLLWYGMYLAQGNRIEESFAEMRKVRQIDPLSPVANTLAIIPALTGRQYEVAIEEGRRILEMDRGNGMARWLLSTAYERKGDFSKAIEFREQTDVLYGANKEDAAQRSARFRRQTEREGPAAYWRTKLEENEALRKKNPGDPYDHAVLYARVGDKQNAFIWLEKAYQSRSQNLIYWLRTDPAFDSFRSDPKYVELVRRVGFPQQ